MAVPFQIPLHPNCLYFNIIYVFATIMDSAGEEGYRTSEHETANVIKEINNEGQSLSSEASISTTPSRIPFLTLITT